MIRRKKLAKIKRQKVATQRVLDDIAEAKLKKAKAVKRRKFMKTLNEWRKADFRSKYKEAFGDCKEHESRDNWAKGSTSKPRSILENY